MKLIDQVRKNLGLETSAEREVWANRLSVIKNTVMVNFWDETLQAGIKAEWEALKTTLPDEEHKAVTLYMLEEQVRLKALCAARCALPAAGVEVSQLRELGFDLNKGRGLGPILRIVGFPEGWDISPVPNLSAPQAIVTDATNTPQLTVFYRHSIAAERPGEGYVAPIA